MLIEKETGFSLIELLIVLVAVNFILLISYHQYIHKNNDHDFRIWYQQFELDLILLQKQTMTTSTHEIIYFRPTSHYYGIQKNTLTAPTIKREFPSDWIISMNTLSHPISFTHSGTIRHPGTMKIETDKNRYFIYFPFGKGRGYYVKNE
ncbi:prepilin-type N-terminal cleavage/methylation domain-containing protein [Amphibacillus sp. MSJ-3]|uniref:prepilin-type N-terminal cleavage/methylation domain-containing protein n=1 Tax=Amphibacillus sp. MSJ-3 TaxID=2841505 RepID=UPI001C0EE9F2|nr:prepilin-type N-terminal cleavage/methylation domain-containing protein [Amphibacillus sp. MSJ-3]MBU5594776.1 prepilin-type N-terminal cleavage/methylation domain-containing protein [Amphibacillus sp. MSJ-3]